MKTIAEKLTIVRTAKAAAGWTDDALRHLIHGTGGSPRRAKRLLNSDPALATMLAEQYRIAVEEGHAHVSAVKLCAEQYRAVFPSATEAPEGGEGDDESDVDAEEAEATAQAIAAVEAAAPVRRRRVKVKPLAEAAAALAALADAQPALL